MTSQAEREARVANTAEAWLADPMKRSLYGELLSAVRSRRAGNGTPAPLAAAAAPPAARGVTSAYGATAPKWQRDPDFLAVKQGRLREEHVAPLQALVDEIRDPGSGIRDPGSGIREERDTDAVPYVDPDSGGVGARVLFIVESPAGPGALRSGMLSPNDDDETAANMWRLCEQAGLPRSAGLHWNAVPWYVGEDGEGKNVSPGDVLDGGLWLDRLLDLLPELRLVVTMGKPAERALQTYSGARDGRHAEWVACLHPSPRNTRRRDRSGGRRSKRSSSVQQRSLRPRDARSASVAAVPSSANQ